jgi:hypothetical protein
MLFNFISPTHQLLSIGAFVVLIVLFACPRYQRTGQRLFYLLCLLGLAASFW